MLDEILRLNIESEPKLPLDMQRLLANTRSDLPLTLNDQVLRYVNYFLGRGRNSLRESIRRSGAYRPMITRILGEEGLPQDLIYLVQAESGFQPRARSNKRAIGMWQFVAARGREYGLNQDRHVDERLDPEKATRAAARHLADLHAQFGHWNLAMAAYDCGPGGVTRAIERTGYADYWELVQRKALPKETANYVPVILALALLDKNAEAFHLDDVVPEHPIHYDTVQTHSRISVELIADATGSTPARIRELNPALLRSATPAGPYALRIPENTAGEFEQEIASVPEAHRADWRRHTMAPGETLAALAARFKVRAQDIAAANHMAAGGLVAGERITIPVPPRPAVAAASRPVQSRKVRVLAGDTLARIARRNHVTVAQLRAWNELSGEGLKAGQVLTIRTPVSALRPYNASARTTRSRQPARRRIAANRPASGVSY